jgi:hypothetical protein
MGIRLIGEGREIRLSISQGLMRPPRDVAREYGIGRVGVDGRRVRAREGRQPEAGSAEVGLRRKHEDRIGTRSVHEVKEQRTTSSQNASVQLRATLEKARESAPLILHFKGFKGDGFLNIRARQLQQLVMPRARRFRSHVCRTSKHRQGVP